MKDGLKVQNFTPHPVKKQVAEAKKSPNLGDTLIGIGLIASTVTALLLAWFG